LAFKTSLSFKIRRLYSKKFLIDIYDSYAVDLINALLSSTLRVYSVESLYNKNEAKVVKSPWARQDSTVLISGTVISGVLVISSLEP
jgi:predicted DNA-binding ribbon-helix-helix protein